MSTLKPKTSYSQIVDTKDEMIRIINKLEKKQDWLALVNDQGCGTPRNYKIENLIISEMLKVQNSLAVLDDIVDGIETSYTEEQTYNYLERGK